LGASACEQPEKDPHKGIRITATVKRTRNLDFMVSMVLLNSADRDRAI
jgi:hypothetical protein